MREKQVDRALSSRPAKAIQCEPVLKKKTQNKQCLSVLYMCVCVRAYTCAHMHAHACVTVHMPECVYECVFVYLHTYAFIHIYVCRN